MSDDDRLVGLIDAALRVLEGYGVPRERVVLGITDPVVRDDDEGTSYQTHVGRTEDGDTAGMLDHIARDAAQEAHKQSIALVGDERCPNCGSPRWAWEDRRRESRPGERPGLYIERWRECMDCHHQGPKR